MKKSEERDYARKWFENDVQPIKEVPSQENDEMEIEDSYLPARDNPPGQNTGQVQAKVLDRSFVSKGNKISVFMANDDDNTIEVMMNGKFFINFFLLAYCDIATSKDI